MRRCDSNVNIGHSSKLLYDENAYEDKLKESVGPLQYRLNYNSVYNENSCMSTMGPRTSYMGNGVSTPIEYDVAMSQAPELVNIESILSNRNMTTERSKDNGANPVNVTKFSLKHPRICNRKFDPMSTKLSYPASDFRELGINRFHDLPKDPQKNIFESFAENTRLSAKDNYIPEVPELWDQYKALPKSSKNKEKRCFNVCF